MAVILNSWCVIAFAAGGNVVSVTTERLGMCWGRFEDKDDIKDTRTFAEIIAGIDVSLASR